MDDPDKSKTLTINEITKVCSNKIIVDPYGNVSPFQWHLFQLHEICRLKDISIQHGTFQYLLTREQLYEVLKSHNPINLEGASLQKLGMVAKKQRNKYSIDNLGGTPVELLKINIYKNDVIFSETNKYLYSGELSSHNSYVLQDPPEYYETRPENGLRKILEAKERGDVLHSLGKLNWANNYCYIDTVLMALLLPIFNGNIHPYIQKFMIERAYINSDFQEPYKQLRICNRDGVELDTPTTIKSLEYIQQKFIDISNMIKGGEIKDAHEFVVSLRQCENRAIRKFWEGNMNDTVDALYTILNLFFIPIQNDGSNHSIYICDDADFPNISSIGLTGQDLIPFDKLPYNTYETQLVQPIENNVTIYNIGIDVLLMQYNTLVGQGIPISDYNEHQHSHHMMLNIIIENSDMVELHNQLESHSVPISSFFNIQQDTTLTDYWQFDKELYDTTIDDGKRVFFLIEDRGNREKYILKENIGVHPIRQVYRKISKQSIINGELVWINIQRYISHSHIINNNIYNTFFEMHIIPQETVLIGDVEKQLQYIHCFMMNHYVLFFNYSGIWYLYNDYYDIVDTESDYFTRVGAYSELLEYTAFGIPKIVQNHSTLLMYV